jgi:hypothetical protein
MKPLLFTLTLVLAAPCLQGQAREVDALIQEVVGADPKEARAFFLGIKTEARALDRSALVKRVAFPIRVDLKARRNVKLRTPAQLLEHFDEVFTPKVLGAIHGQAYEALFVNYQGIMIGSGEVWFTGLKGPSGNFDQLRIIAINN